MDIALPGPSRVLTDAELLDEVEGFLASPGAPTPTRFGLDAMGEGGLVKSLQGGRSLSLKNVNRVISYMAEWRRAKAAAPQPAPEWPIASANNGDNLICPNGEADAEASDPRPFSATCSGPATDLSRPRCSTGPTGVRPEADAA